MVNKEEFRYKDIGLGQRAHNRKRSVEVLKHMTFGHKVFLKDNLNVERELIADPNVRVDINYMTKGQVGRKRSKLFNSKMFY